MKADSVTLCTSFRVHFITVRSGEQIKWLHISWKLLCLLFCVLIAYFTQSIHQLLRTSNLGVQPSKYKWPHYLEIRVNSPARASQLQQHFRVSCTLSTLAMPKHGRRHEAHAGGIKKCTAVFIPSVYSYLSAWDNYDGAQRTRWKPVINLCSAATPLNLTLPV